MHNYTLLVYYVLLQATRSRLRVQNVTDNSHIVHYAIRAVCYEKCMEFDQFACYESFKSFIHLDGSEFRRGFKIAIIVVSWVPIPAREKAQ